MDERLQANTQSYRAVYEGGANLAYPADHVIRFHNIVLKSEKPSGRLLDFGCGNGNNARFFIEAGYEVHGTEVTEAVLPSLNARLGPYPKDRFHILPPYPDLPWPDDHFDIVFSNQVLYYLGDKATIQSMCCEFARVLRPGGLVYFTMQGPRNSYIAKFGTEVGPKEYRVEMPEGHRLHGRREYLYVPPDEADVKDLFSAFKCRTVGQFEQIYFGESTFHWIFIGEGR